MVTLVNFFLPLLRLESEPDPYIPCLFLLTFYLPRLVMPCEPPFYNNILFESYPPHSLSPSLDLFFSEDFSLCNIPPSLLSILIGNHPFVLLCRRISEILGLLFVLSSVSVFHPLKRKKSVQNNRRFETLSDLVSYKEIRKQLKEYKINRGTSSFCSARRPFGAQ